MNQRGEKRKLKVGGPKGERRWELSTEPYRPRGPGLFCHLMCSVSFIADCTLSSCCLMYIPGIWEEIRNEFKRSFLVWSRMRTCIIKMPRYQVNGGGKNLDNGLN